MAGSVGTVAGSVGMVATVDGMVAGSLRAAVGTCGFADGEHPAASAIAERELPPRSGAAPSGTRLILQGLGPARSPGGAAQDRSSVLGWQWPCSQG